MPTIRGFECAGLDAVAQPGYPHVHAHTSKHARAWLMLGETEVNYGFATRKVRPKKWGSGVNFVSFRVSGAESVHVGLPEIHIGCTVTRHSTLDTATRIGTQGRRGGGGRHEVHLGLQGRRGGASMRPRQREAFSSLLGAYLPYHLS